MRQSSTARLQELIHRRDTVLAILYPPTAAHARIMERAGCEALFVGTGGVVGAYTGLAEIATATMSECVEIAGRIADSVRIPVAGCRSGSRGSTSMPRRSRRHCPPSSIARANM
jgi:2-methylisocitrate lyase-like PEP mutase family enzyme